MNHVAPQSKSTLLPPLLLLLYFCLSAALYTTQLVLPFNLFAHVAQAPISFSEIVRRQSTPALNFLLTFLNLFILYALAYWTCRKALTQRLAPLILMCGLILALLLSVTYPIGANDVVNYAGYGEALAFHGRNPMVVTLAEVDGAAFVRYSVFRNETSNYGPLWTWISAAVVWMMGTDSLTHNLLAFKVVAILAYGTQAILIYAILRRRDPTRAVGGLLAFAWNPLVLYEFAANGHNDAVMMAFGLLGIFFWDRGRPFLMVAALVLSMLVKIPTAPLLPLFLLAAARQRGPGRGFWTTLASGGLLALALVGIAYLSLPDGWAALLNFMNRSNLFTHSLPALVNLTLQVIGLDQTAAQNVARTAALLALGIWYALQLSRTWRSPTNALQYAYAVVLFLLFFATPWFQPWYVTWLVALAALFPHPAAPTQAGLFSLTATISYVVYGFIWFWYARLGSWGRALGINLLAVGTTYLVPWVYTLWLWVRERTKLGTHSIQQSKPMIPGE